MIMGVLFDMDGVLVDTERFYNRRRVDYLETQGFVFDGIPDLSGSNDDAIWRYYVPGDSELREALRCGYEAYADEHPVPYEELLNPEARFVLTRLHEQGVKTAIASSSPPESIRRCIEAADIESVLDCVVSGHECRAFKPDPEVYLTSMEALSLRPCETLVVEDSPIGIEAGKRAGCRVLALRPCKGVRLDQSRADRIIDRLTDLFSEVNR